MPYTSIAFVIVFAVLYYRAAESEDGPALLWTTLSVMLSLATLFYLGWGWLGSLLVQGGLFLGIAVFRAFRKS